MKKSNRIPRKSDSAQKGAQVKHPDRKPDKFPGKEPRPETAIKIMAQGIHTARKHGERYFFTFSSMAVQRAGIWCVSGHVLGEGNEEFLDDFLSMLPASDLERSIASEKKGPFEAFENRFVERVTDEEAAATAVTGARAFTFVTHYTIYPARLRKR